MARLYCRIVGPVLLLVGVVGIFWAGIPGFLSINEPGEIVVHLATGALATYAGFSGGSYGRAAVLYAKVFGIVYLLLTLVGFIVPTVIPGIIVFDLGCNLVHLLLGLGGIYAGYFARATTPAPAA